MEMWRNPGGFLEEVAIELSMIWGRGPKRLRAQAQESNLLGSFPGSVTN